jgi:hypothetical protein
MAAQRFRSAFNGFNKEDVVHYIEYLNNQHNAQIEQLNNQLQQALKAPSADPKLQEQLDAALARCAELEAQLSSASAATEQELEAYRRAERAERLAQERAQQICTQANAILADATVKAETAAAHMTDLAAQANARLSEYQQAVSDTQTLFQGAIDALYSLKVTEEI